MNARERTAAERLEQWQFDSSAAPPDPDDIRTVVAAVRRWDRLANEELTDDDKNFIEATIESINVNNSNDRRYLSAHADYLCVGLMSIVKRLQAHLAAAKDAVAVAEGIASDALEDRGLPRIEEVRRETARQIAELNCITEYAAVRIRRRFSLAAPQPAGTPQAVCQRCGGRGEVNQGQHNDPEFDGDDCPDCAGTGRTPARREEAT